MKIRQSGGIAIIDVIGTVRFGPESDKLREGILAAFDKGSKKILLNLPVLKGSTVPGLGPWCQCMLRSRGAEER